MNPDAQKLHRIHLKPKPHSESLRAWRKMMIDATLPAPALSRENATTCFIFRIAVFGLHHSQHSRVTLFGIRASIRQGIIALTHRSRPAHKFIQCRRDRLIRVTARAFFRDVRACAPTEPFIFRIAINKLLAAFAVRQGCVFGGSPRNPG